MTELPTGWTLAKLGDLALYQNGRGFRKTEWTTTGRPIIRIQNLTDPAKSFNYFAGDAEESYTVRPGDLLISWAATLGAFIWNGPEAVLNQHIFKVGPFINKKFLYYLIQYVLEELYLHTHGSGMVHITKDKFETLPVRLPPLSEQQRIVTALEGYLSRLDAGVAGLKRGYVLADDLRRAIRDYFTWPATEEGLPSGWRWGTLSDVLERVEAGRSFACEPRPAEPGEWGVIKVSAMTWGSFRENENKAVPSSRVAEPRFEIKPGDILVSRANTEDYVGAPVLVGECRERLLLSDKSLRLVPLPGVDRSWLIAMLASSRVRAEISSRATGTKDSMRNISQNSLQSIRIPIPENQIQPQTASQIRERTSYAARLEESLGASSDQAEDLRRALLSAAFAGKLAEQDPSDEPASVLLDRIRSDKVAVIHATRTRAKLKSFENS